MDEEFAIEQWDKIIVKFTQTFDGLGTVLHNEAVSYTHLTLPTKASV